MAAASCGSDCFPGVRADQNSGTVWHIPWDDVIHKGAFHWVLCSLGRYAS